MRRLAMMMMLVPAIALGDTARRFDVCRDEEANFLRSVQIVGKNVELTIAGDDTYIVWLNGHELPIERRDAMWGAAVTINVDKWVKQRAHNQFHFRVINRQGRHPNKDNPGGLAYTLIRTNEDGTRTLIAKSDSLTQANNRAALEIAPHPDWAKFSATWIWVDPDSIQKSPPPVVMTKVAAKADPQWNWREKLEHGVTVTAELTHDDTTEFVKDDPLGTLLGGTPYEVRYEKGAFVVTGFSESTQDFGTWSYRNAQLAQNKISLWGVIATFDPKTGVLYEAQYGKIGRLR